MQFVLFVFKPKTYLSLDRALILHIRIGINPSRTGDKLVYYYLYHEEASIPKYLCPRPFNRPFLIFIKTLYLAS